LDDELGLLDVEAIRIQFIKYFGSDNKKFPSITKPALGLLMATLKRLSNVASSRFGNLVDMGVTYLAMKALSNAVEPSSTPRILTMRPVSGNIQDNTDWEITTSESNGKMIIIGSADAIIQVGVKDDPNVTGGRLPVYLSYKEVYELYLEMKNANESLANAVKSERWRRSKIISKMKTEPPCTICQCTYYFPTVNRGFDSRFDIGDEAFPTASFDFPCDAIMEEYNPPGWEPHIGLLKSCRPKS
jgi:hypothetical protein